MQLSHPDWLHPGTLGVVDPADPSAAMAVAVDLAGRNVALGTGGPFGAIVVDGNGRVAGAGVNVVVAQGASIAHAEVMALLDAQMRLGRPRLNADGPGPWTLVTSAQPCVMCFGVAFWAGLDALVTGARVTDVEALAGFDEGPVPEDWASELALRQIAVTQDVLRPEACAVLAAYGERHGVVY